MALNKTALKAAIKAAMDDVASQPNLTIEQGRELVADKLATAIDNYVKGAAVNAGIAVQVNTGTGTGSTTAPGTLS